MGQPLAIVTSQWPIVPKGIYVEVGVLLGLTSLFTFFFIFGPPCFNTGIASSYELWDVIAQANRHFNGGLAKLGTAVSHSAQQRGLFVQG